MPDIPPEYVVSQHAELRLWERLHCKKEKNLKTAIKAFNSKSVPIPKMTKTQNRTEYYWSQKPNRVAREMMGYVFVFALDHNRGTLPPQKTLVTIL